MAVGGGSCCDYAKAVSVSVHCDEDPWEKYYLKFEEPDCEIVPVGCVLTMVGTGSEMNAGAVIINHESKMKIGHVFADENIMPKFKRFAVDVWDVDADGKTDEQTALEGLVAMESWMKELGLVMNLTELGVTADMVEEIAGSTLVLDEGYKVLERKEIGMEKTRSSKINN